MNFILDLDDEKVDDLVVQYLQDCVKIHASFKHDAKYHSLLANLLGTIEYLMLPSDYEVWYDSISSDLFWS